MALAILKLCPNLKLGITMNSETKTIIFGLLTIVKAIVIIIGVGKAIKSYGSGIRHKNSKNTRDAIKYILLMFAIIILLSLSELAMSWIFPTSD